MDFANSLCLLSPHFPRAQKTLNNEMLATSETFKALFDSYHSALMHSAVH